MAGKHLSCVLLADRHHGLTEGVRGLLETAFGSVIMVADAASLIDGADRIQPDVGRRFRVRVTLLTTVASRSDGSVRRLLCMHQIHA